MTNTELLRLYCSAIHDENMLILRVLEGFVDEKSRKVIESFINDLNEKLNDAVIETLSPVTIDKYIS